MSIQTWGQMNKSQTDNELVEGAISRIVEQHNDDPDAHLEDGQSLKSHRASEVVDHLARSIVNDKIAEVARAYTAILKIPATSPEPLYFSGIDYSETPLVVVGGIETPTEILARSGIIDDNKYVYLTNTSGALSYQVLEAPVVPEGARIYKIKVKIRAKLINATVSDREFTLGYYDGPVVSFLATTSWQDFEVELYYLRNENGDWKTITQEVLNANLFSIDYEGPAGGATQNLLALSSAYIEASIVSSLDSSDFFNLNDALDYLNGIGGGSLFVKNGNYDCGKTYNYLNSYVSIIGESLAGVIFTAYDKDYNLVVGADLPAEYTTGTITLTQNSKNVLASGVSWTSIKTVGKYLLDKRTGHYYKISAFVNSTNITLEETYQGPTTASLGYIIVSMNTENVISNLTMTFEMVFKNATNCVVENVNFLNCTILKKYLENIQFIDCDFTNISTSTSYDYITNSLFTNNTFKNFTALCLNFDSNSVGNTIENNLFIDNKAQCIYIHGSNNILRGNTFLNCGWTLGQLNSAILLMDSSRKNILANNILRNVQSYGIGSQASANYNICIGNICIDNGQAGIVNNGAQSITSGNLV